MDGAGLKKSITTVYEGGVDRMLSGNAISRAACSHILVDIMLFLINCKDTLFTCSTDVPPAVVSSGL